MHERFGEGTIIAVTDSGENEKITVKFDNGNPRTLLVKYARVTLIG